MNDLISIIREHYAPATSEREADLFLKTIEVSERLRAVYPGDYSDIELFDALKAAGFKTADLGGLEIAWMFRQKA